MKKEDVSHQWEHPLFVRVGLLTNFAPICPQK